MLGDTPSIAPHAYHAYNIKNWQGTDISLHHKHSVFSILDKLSKHGAELFL